MSRTLSSCLLLAALLFASSCSDSTGPGLVVEAPPVDTTTSRGESDHSSPASSIIVIERETFTGEKGSVPSVTDRVYIRHFTSDTHDTGRTTSFWLNYRQIAQNAGSAVHWLIAPGPSIPLRFNGSQHRIRTFGAGGAPSILDSLNAPSAPIRMIYPRTGDTLSLSKGITLQWERLQPHQSIGSVSYSLNSSSRGISNGGVDDASDLAITAEQLEKLQIGTGPVDLSISRSTSQYRTFSNQSHRYITLRSTDRIRVWLVK